MKLKLVKLKLLSELEWKEYLTPCMEIPSSQSIQVSPSTQFQSHALRIPRTSMLKSRRFPIPLLNRKLSATGSSKTL